MIYHPPTPDIENTWLLTNFHYEDILIPGTAQIVRETISEQSEATIAVMLALVVDEAKRRAGNN